MSLIIQPLSPERVADLDAVFAARGCAEAKRCYCMYYRRTGRWPQPAPGQTLSARNREDLLGLLGRGIVPGLLAYRDGHPVGWVSLGPREDFLRLKHSPTLRALDAAEPWSIVCFVVPSVCRGEGVAHALLAGAIRYARENGVPMLEAYPVDRAVTGAPDAPWFGSLTMFAQAGFVEVARRKPARPIVRLRLGA